jgi:adenosylhomocysteinase
MKNADTLEVKIHTLPPEIDAEVASIKLDSLGGGLELLTDEQRDYLSGWQEGT